jgi:hypothetical protein
MQQVTRRKADIFEENRNIESNSIVEIKKALEQILYVPDLQLKSKIIEELLNYLELKFEQSNYPITSFITTNDSKINGFIICQVNPHYSSYGRKCGTFGWLYAQSLEICALLMKNCARFAHDHETRKLRGPINFPKSLGGLGYQVTGFEEPMLYGVAYNDPKSRINKYLIRLGFYKESEYSCVRVDQKTWKNGKNVDKNIVLRYGTLKELIDRREEILNLGKNSFHEILPDSSGRNERFDEFIYAFNQIPKANRKLEQNFNLTIYKNNPSFYEAWNNCDLDNIEMFAPMAFDRHTDELVGILLGLPNLYEAWLGHPITRCNVDTAMVRHDYTGKGIFSALNNIGQQTCRFFGVNYFEGTSIWSNNSQAINSIFPHSTPIRKHYIFQKRI